MTQVPMVALTLLGGSGRMDNASTAVIDKTVVVPAPFLRTVRVLIAPATRRFIVQCLPPGVDGTDFPAGVSSLPAGVSLQIEVCTLKDLTTLGTPAQDFAQSYTWMAASPGNFSLDEYRDYDDALRLPAEHLTSLIVRMEGYAGLFSSGHIPVGPTELHYAANSGYDNANYVTDRAGHVVLSPTLPAEPGGDRWVAPFTGGQRVFLAANQGMAS